MKKNTRIWINLILAIVIAFPVGTIISFLLTPLLWRLGNIIHIELAGHSGPSDWVFYIISFIIAALIFVILNKLNRKK